MNFVNPPFEILSIEKHDQSETFGDDQVAWWVEVKTASYVVPVYVTFEMVMGYCQQQHPEVGEYFRSVRRNVKGFGPKHSEMFDIMTEEGFDLLPHIYNCIKDCFDLEKYHQHDVRLEQALTDRQTSERMEARSAALEENMKGMRESTLRNTAFKDCILELLNNEVLERYPEIVNSDPKYIKELQGILVDAVLDLGSKIDTLSFRAAKGH
ncbi:MAG: hypothetical protein EP314_08185 [Bacteroidetes bacterium]|nr:MAG: hypothetical protein EP314_08185 [Bacteroidota bacterium]